jgi:hypothetical protein
MEKTKIALPLFNSFLGNRVMVNNNNLGSRVRRVKMMHQIVPQMSLLGSSKNWCLHCRKLLIHREAMPNKQLDSIMRK